VKFFDEEDKPYGIVLLVSEDSAKGNTAIFRKEEGNA